MRSEHVRKLKKGEENENEAAGEEGERQGPSSAGSSTRRGHRPSRRAADEHARCTPRDPLRVRAPPAACSSPRRHALRVLPPAELCGGAGCSGADTLHSSLRGLPAAALICGRAFRGRASRPPQRTTRGRVRAALRPRRGRLKNPAQRARISAALRQSGCAAGATHPSPTVPGAVLPRRAPRSLSAAAQPHDGMELRAADAHRGAPGGDEGLPRAMGASPAPRPARRVRHTAPRRLRPRFSLPDFRRRARAREFSNKTGKRACFEALRCVRGTKALNFSVFLIPNLAHPVGAGEPGSSLHGRSRTREESGAWRER